MMQNREAVIGNAHPTTRKPRVPGVRFDKEQSQKTLESTAFDSLAGLKTLGECKVSRGMGRRVDKVDRVDE